MDQGSGPPQGPKPESIRAKGVRVESGQGFKGNGPATLGWSLQESIAAYSGFWSEVRSLRLRAAEENFVGLLASV